MLHKSLLIIKKNDTDKSFMDQNALNAILGGNSLWISPKFNMMATCSPETVRDLFKTENPIKKMADFYEISVSDMHSAWKNPAILHVTSETKAWKNINAARIDEWIQYSLKDDMLKVAKNWCDSLSADFSKRLTDQQNAFIQKTSEFEQELSQQKGLIDALRNENTIFQNENAELNSKISALQQALAESQNELRAQREKLAELHGLILNTRHRTLYGALEFLWQKFFKK